MRNSLRTRLTIAFISLAIVPLLFVGGLVGWQSFRSQQEQALNLQRQVAQRVASEVNAFIQERGNELRLLTEIRGLQTLDQEQQSDLLFGLLSAQDVYEELALLDNQGQEKLRLSRLAIISTGDLVNRSGAAEFERPKATSETYYSSVWFDEKTSEPFMTMAIPLVDLRSGEFTGALVADFRFKAVQDLMARAEAGDSGAVYVVSEPDNRIIAHGNPTVVLQETQFAPPEEDGFYLSFDGTDVAMAVEHIKLGEQEFAIVAEKPAAEALSLAINTVYITVIVMAISLVIAGGLGFLIVRQIVRPVEAMSNTARAISRGDLSQQVKLTGQDELGVLARAFNSMTAQLGELIGSLEERVVSRTQRLEITANISERLNAILNLEELLFEVVNQVKENFDYYHAHIYLVDENQEYLVMTAGTGPAGAKMKEQGHRIRLDAPTSLVARVACNKEIVTIDNVREAPDWLPNELLPDTYSEMAVPIVLEEKVVGVLDVQEDKIAGLDEGDAGLLRSLANQVAVAVHNARQFEQVEAALAEAHELQQRYLQQAWDRSQVARRGAGRVQYNLDEVVTLPEATIAEARQQALARQQLAVVAINGDDGHTRPALVAPITLQNVPIGDLQLHGLDPDREFTEGELALISAVVDQVTQVAEGLRLLDETQEWASRERLIGQVSDKLHRAPDIDTLMQLAVDELARVLGPARTFVRLGSEAEFGVGPDTGLDNGGNGTDLPEDSLAEKIDDPSLRPTNGSSGESELNGNA